VKYYEAMIVVHPNIEEAGLTKITNDIKGLIAKRGGEIVYTEDMGKRKLAYPVEKQRFGTYLLIQYTGDGVGNSRMLLDLEHKDNVLAQMIVKIREQDVREERDDETNAGFSDADSELSASPKDSVSEPESTTADTDEKQDESSDEAMTEATDEDSVEEAAEESETDTVAEVESEDAVEAAEETEVAEESEVVEEN
jgi:small subunit ribosomal protein S6